MLNTRQGREAEILGVVKREGSRTNPLHPHLPSHVHSQHPTSSPFLGPQTAEASMGGKAQGVRLALRVPSDQESHDHCCDPIMCLGVGPPVVLAQLLSIRADPAPLHCILPSHCLNSSQVSL